MQLAMGPGGDLLRREPVVKSSQVAGVAVEDGGVPGERLCQPLVIWPCNAGYYRCQGNAPWVGPQECCPHCNCNGLHR